MESYKDGLGVYQNGNFDQVYILQDSGASYSSPEMPAKNIENSVTTWATPLRMSPTKNGANQPDAASDPMCEASACRKRSRSRSVA